MSYTKKRDLRKLKSNNDIVITKKSKSGQIVLLDNRFYGNKVDQLLEECLCIEVKKVLTNI